MEFVGSYLNLQKRIDRRLGSLFRKAYPATLYDPIRYTISQKGKRVRPILLIFSCEAIGGSIKECFDAALAVEILHNFTLVHDDIMDNDLYRRGVKTVHAKWDESVALLCGDGLIALAYRSLLRSNEKYIKRITSIFSEGIVKVCEGQSLDKDFEEMKEVGMDEYIFMIEEKTGVLMSISAEIGCILGGGTEEEIRSMRLYGMQLGVAFQIQDDLLDIISHKKVLGKQIGSDLVQGKKTYPILLLNMRAGKKEKNNFMDIMKRKKIRKSDIEYIKELLDKYEIIFYIRGEVHRRINLAKRYVSALSDVSCGENLIELADMIDSREY